MADSVGSSEQVFVAALTARNYTVVDDLLRSGDIDVDRFLPLIGGVRAVHYACTRGAAQLLELLLKYRPDIGLRGTCGQYPIHVAVRNSVLQPIKQLVEAGASLLCEDGFGSSPFQLAVSVGNSIVIDYVLHQPEIMGNRHQRDAAMCAALRNDNASVVASLLAASHEVDWNTTDASAVPYVVQEDMVMALFTSPIAMRSLDVCRLLAADSAWRSARDARSRTLLHHYAESVGSPEACEILLALGADPAAKDMEGATPLHSLAYQFAQRFTDSFRLLLRYDQYALRVPTNSGCLPMAHGVIRASQLPANVKIALCAELQSAWLHGL